MEQNIQVCDYSKPLTPLQKELTSEMVPAGDVYSFRLSSTSDIPMQDRVQQWLSSSGWDSSKDEYGCPIYVAGSKGEKNVLYLPAKSDPSDVIQCVLNDRNLNSFLSFVQEDSDLCISMMNHLGKAYDLTRFEYAMLFHQKQEAIDEWMKLQVEKAPMMTKEHLAAQFRDEAFVERSGSLRFGTGANDLECQWARMEIDRLVERGELELKNVKDKDGYGAVRLAVPKQKEAEWKDVSKEQDMFRIAKETDKGMVILSMDAGNHVLAKAEPFQPTKKPKILYKGKSLNEGMRAAENYIQGKSVASR